MPRPFCFMLRLILTICITATGCIPGKAQLPVFRNYNTQDGLPSSETYCIEQDKRGYIYIGTDRGLARFDGRHFETVTTKDGLVNNSVFTLLEDKGKLWYHTYSSLVGYLQNDTAHTYPHNMLIRKIMHSGLWSNIALDRNGLLYLNKRIIEQGYEIVGIDTPVGKHLSVPLDADYAHIYITSGRRWLRAGPDSAKKVKLFSLETGRLLQEFEPDSRVVQSTVPVCGYIKRNATWLLYKDVYKLQGQTYTKVITCDDPALYMLVDKEENVWLGYQNKGLVLFRKKDNYSRAVHLLDHHSVSGILEDREGGLWFTTLEHGVYYLPPDFLLAYDARTGLSRAKVRQINFNGKETVVLQSDFSLWAFRNGTDSSWYKPLGNNLILGSAMTKGYFYFAKPYTWKPVSKSLPYIRINTSRILYAGAYIWTITRNELFRFEQNGLPAKKQIVAHIPFLICLKEIQDDKLLLGGLDGLFLYEHNRLQRVPLNKTVYKERMSDIQELDNDHWIIATSGQGLLVLDKNTYRIVRHVTEAEGLKNMICNVVRCDDDGVVWAGTNKGLYKIEHILDTRNTLIQWADINDGINSNEINDICIINDDLWLGTAQGISIFPRKRNLQHQEGIPVLIQQLTVNEKLFNTEALPRLHYKQNNISIGFIGLNYHYAPVLRYRYRLLRTGGETWSYTTDPVVNYNDLPPGNYTFEYSAMAPNHSGKLFTAALPFTITPPFWLTWWFIFLSVMTLVCCVLLFIHYRVRSFKNQIKLKTDLGIYRDKALRDQMSPHFIYNALNAIQNYILKHDTDKSVSFLSKFSRLMRLIFNNTVQEVIPLQKDLEALQLYVEMESMRFPGQLNFHLPESLPEKLSRALVPPLLLQPFVENAVLHGLLPKHAPGNIWLTIEQENNCVKVCIKDDGIGRVASAKIKIKKRAFLNEKDMPARSHTGTSITIARIAQAWGKYPDQSRFKMTDLFLPDGNPSGTLIEFYLPLNYDKNNNS